MIAKVVLILIGSLLMALPAHSDIPGVLGEIHSDTINTLFGADILPVGDFNNDENPDFLTFDF